jgi:hypothetical protein
MIYLYYLLAAGVILLISQRPEILILGIAAVAIYYYKDRLAPKHTQENKPDVDVWIQYNKLVKDKRIFNKNNVSIYKGPTTLKYILMQKDMKGIMEDLAFILKFHPDILINVLILLENFFKIHYNVMIHKYDACSYIPVLIDIESEVLNTLSMFVFNLPNMSTTIDIENIDSFMEVKIRDIQSLTQKYMTILKHKFKCHHKFDFKDNDYTLDKHMMF